MSQALVVRPKRHKCASWACNVCGDRLGRSLLPWLGQRVRARAATHSWLFVTLTLDPKRFGSPLEAWEDVRRNRRISRAVGAWSSGRNLGHVSYLCKMELQKSGWPHWHLLVEVPRERVDPSTGEVVPVEFRSPTKGDEGDGFGQYGSGSNPLGVWRWGRSDVRFGVSDGEVAYLCKYACKEAGGDDALAASGLPDRVNWVACSRGFWAEVGLQDPTSEGAAVEYADESISRTIVPASLFERVEFCRRTSICEVTIPTTGEVREFEVPISRKRLCQALEEAGGHVLEVFPESGIARVLSIDAGAMQGLAFLLGDVTFSRFVDECIDAVDGTASAALDAARAAVAAVERVRRDGARAAEARAAPPGGGWCEREAFWRERLPDGEALPRGWEDSAANPRARGVVASGANACPRSEAATDASATERAGR